MYRTGRRWIPIPPHEHSSLPQSSSSWAKDVASCVMLSMLVCLVVLLFLLADQAFGQVPHYSVAIGHVTGNGPATELEFDLTLRVASWGAWATVCAHPRMYATVSYRGVPLAATATMTQQICAGPMEAVEHPLVARGSREVVPGSHLDSLAVDMRSGVPQFDVELHGPGTRKLAWACGLRMVGDAGALERECTRYRGRNKVVMRSSNRHDGREHAEY